MTKEFYFNTKEEVLDFMHFVHEEADKVSKVDTQNPSYWEYHVEKLDREIKRLESDKFSKEDCEYEANRGDGVVVKVVRSLQDEKEIDKLREIQRKVEKFNREKGELQIEQNRRDERFFGLGYFYERTLGIRGFKNRSDRMEEINAVLKDCREKKEVINQYRKSEEMIHDYALYYDTQREQFLKDKKGKEEEIQEKFSMEKGNTVSLKPPMQAVEKKLDKESTMSLE